MYVCVCVCVYLRLKVHVENAVGLVHHQILERSQVESFGVLQVIDQAARSR